MGWSLDQILLAFTMLHFVFQDQTWLLSWLSPDFLFLYSNLYDEKDIFLVLVLESVVGIYRTGQLQLLWHQWLGHKLGLWSVLERSQDHSVVFETAAKYCIWKSFVDYEGYSISSKGFLPTDIMVI